MLNILRAVILTLLVLQIGQLKLLEIRKKLEERSNFDIRNFHDTVLGIGAVPLDILEEVML